MPATTAFSTPQRLWLCDQLGMVSSFGCPLSLLDSASSWSLFKSVPGPFVAHQDWLSDAHNPEITHMFEPHHS